MILRLTLGMLIVCAIGCWRGGAAAPPVAPDPSIKPILKCAMRWTGHIEKNISGIIISRDVPDRAEVTITNISNANVDIGSQQGPYANLNLRVVDPTKANVKTERLSAVCSPLSLHSVPYILKPGAVFRCEVDLLGGVPEEKRIAGAYQVQAIYTIENKEYTSDWIEIKWPWLKK